MTDVAAVIFDLDGVLIDSETIWDDARRSLVEEQGGTWLASATRDMMGMSSREWSVYLHERLGVGVEPEEISARVADDVAQRYHVELPLLPGAHGRGAPARVPRGRSGSRRHRTGRSSSSSSMRAVSARRLP